ncbi:retroviral-like aspartic protease family protein [Deltaproteobacteria bacterium TL4]
MLINKFPFYRLSDGILRPMLPIEIQNPHTGKSFRTWGLIDTGADNCAFPAQIAKELGHELKSGKPKEIQTGNGVTQAFEHTTKINIFTQEVKVAYTTSETMIDFMPHLRTPLLGVKNFLDYFILSIDYPNKVFSVQNHEVI